MLLCFTSFAQVNLIIEDATGTGFLLGINGFLQNTDPVKELVVKKLDTFPFDVRVELSPNVFFEKKMHFHSKGNYQYIITTNSRDELQLRYRGEPDALPAAATTIDANNVIPLRPLASLSPAKEKEKPASVIPEKKSVSKAPAITTPISTTTAIPAKTQTTETKTPKSIPPKVEAVATPKKDTTVAVVPPPPPPPPVKKEKTFGEFYTELQSTEFEFEKLNAAQEFGKKHPYTVEELKQILAAMKYDNTRLEFMRATKNQWKNLTNVNSLRSSFEYEISKEQFNDLTH